MNHIDMHIFPIYAVVIFAFIFYFVIILMATLPFEDGDRVLIHTLNQSTISVTSEGEIQPFPGDKPDDSCIFTLVRKGSAKWAILNVKTKKYLSVTKTGKIYFESNLPLAPETFTFHGIDPLDVYLTHENPNGSIGIIDTKKIILNKKDDEGAHLSLIVL